MQNLRPIPEGGTPGAADAETGGDVIVLPVLFLLQIEVPAAANVLVFQRFRILPGLIGMRMPGIHNNQVSFPDNSCLISKAALTKFFLITPGQSPRSTTLYFVDHLSGFCNERSDQHGEVYLI